MEERRSSVTTNSTPDTESVISPVQAPDIIIDGTLLREVARRRLRSWLVLGPVIFIAIVAYQLLRMPQSYTTMVSVSVQQSQGAGGSSALVLLGGGNAGGKKYIGIIHSRLVAEAVESKFHLQQFYKLPSRRSAVDLLMGSVRPEDNAGEGLLFLHVTLPGPARFASDPDHRREKAKRLTAAVANEYVAQLQDYYATSDNDRDSVLLNAANSELQRARDAYDSATANVRHSISELRHTEFLASPSPGTEEAGGRSGGGADGGAEGLQSLYDQMVRLEASIRGAEAVAQSEEASLQRQLKALAILPSDDSLLRTARQDLTDAQVNLTTLRKANFLSEDNPRVVAAREKVRIAEEVLTTEERGLRQGLTTQHLAEETRLKGLQAQRDSILEALHKAESKLPVRREHTISLLELQKEEDITLAALKEAEEKAVDLHMSVPSGKSHISVVDSAIPPEGGQPSISRAGLIAGAFTVLLFFPSVLWDYQRQARQRIALARQLATVPHTNGTKPA
jgi:hypothetical protein